MEINFATLTNQQTSTDAAAQSLATDFDDFLMLLTTQMQNQDPLSPMDSTEFTNQLIGFSGVEQQINTNQKLDTLNSLSMASAFTGSIGYIGKDVSYIGSQANWNGTSPVKISYALEDQAADVTLNIKDASGQVVYTRDLSAIDTSGSLTWDGVMTSGEIAPAGNYTISIAALDDQGAAVNSITALTGRATGIETQNGTFMVLMGDQFIPVGNILNVKDPES